MSEPYLLSGIPARWIDHLLCYSEDSSFPSFYQGLAKVVAVTAFPILASIDCVYYSSKTLKDWTWSYVQLNDETLTSLEDNKEVVKRVAYCILLSPLSLFIPDIATHHCLPKIEDGRIHHGCGKLYNSKGTVKCPTTVEDIQEIVKESSHVSVVGSGMSQGGQALPLEGHTLLDLKNLYLKGTENQKIIVDAQSRTARVAAGVTWEELQNEAQHHKLAPCIAQASNVFSIGGSISANIHGWDIRNGGTIADTITSITIVNADGQLQTIPKNHINFRCIVGGYGGFGVIVEATIQLTEDAVLEQTGTPMKIEDYVNQFDENIQNNSSVLMHLFRLELDPDHLFEEGISVNYKKVADASNQAPPLINEPKKGHFFNRFFLHLFRRVRWMRKIFWKHERKDAITAKKATRNKTMRDSPIRMANHNSLHDTEWLQEFFIPKEHLVSFLNHLKQRLKENDVTLLNASVRFVKQDTLSELKYAREGDRFAIVLFFNQKLNEKEIQKTKKWVQETIDEALDNGGNYYLPYQHFATQEQFTKGYPRSTAVQNRKRRVDPTNKFSNQFYQHYLNQTA